ncbi:hypothetical protein M3201_18660 [Paenibacillus motobuensis]|uniref:DUF6711 family protein n=1 Tax=Paenibacillus TaxID=44249 RepID=UPI00203DD259|nr:MULTISPECIES: DUF6711 family protein [Paenibacillus]MCM3041719.1 hypothetical protein [Paenibacillus lutimineralis]MCM3648823.1 hypothetical protein [Paenibacillus motobuensis]
MDADVLKINGQNIVVFPDHFSVSLMDLDDAETSVRTRDTKLHRDRLGTKRKLEMGWGPLKWKELSSLLKSVRDEFVEVTYPDTETGEYETKVFYVGDRTATYMISKGKEIMWGGLKIPFTEQ